MKIDIDKVQLTLAEKGNACHKKGLWVVFNENIDFATNTSEEIPYEQHCRWWENIFDIEYLYVIIYKSDVIGYIRLTKTRTDSKEFNEISIAFVKKYQNKGIGSFSYKLFEKEMKKIGIKRIVA